MTTTLRVMNLTKKFSNLVAVDNISFTATEGEVVGILGPNGAGKSTTLKMLCGFLSPSSGTAYLDGYDIMDQPVAAKRTFGYLPEGAPSYTDMTVRSFLSFIADIRGVPAADKSRKLAQVLTQLNLQTVVDQRIETLSKGYKRRVGLAQALIHDPKILVLDEPTDGLDPNQKREVRELIAELAKNKIIILSTHVLEEVAAICDRVIVIASGKILLDTTPGDLLNQSAHDNVVAALEEVFISIKQEYEVIT